MRAYLESTRSPWYSLVFILPLWLLYELLEGLLNLGHGQTVLNGADALLDRFFFTLGVHGQLAAETCIAAVVLVCVLRADKTHRSVKPAWLAGMFVESAVYAVLFGAVVARLVRLFVPGFVLGLNAQGGAAGLNVGMQFMTSLGAGVFEELVFRVLLMGGITWAGVRWCKLRPGVSLTVGALVSSLIFSAFHYVGTMPDPFTLASFVFRFIAGLVLALIYRVRGFGIAACTHALYDVLIVMQGLF